GHGARPGDPPGGAVRAAAVPRRAVGPARRAAHGDGGARARRRARRRGGLADRLGRHGRGGPPARRVRPGSGGDRMTGLHTPTRPGTDRPQGGARGTWALRDRTATVWLAAAVVVALVHPFVPGSRWLMVHLVLLGALTHSIMVWTHHFAQAILKTPPGLDDRARQSRRLTLLLVGVALVLAGVPTGLWPVTVVGATLVTAAVVLHGLALWRRLRHALPGRFRVTVRYYLASAALLPVGIVLGVL